jgi:hypothetical protein
MLVSGIVVLFKLLSMMIGKRVMKGLYLLILVLFVAGILKQGKEGGELVYEYGANVEKVQELDSQLFDLQEELEELQEEQESEGAADAETKPAQDVTSLPDEEAAAIPVETPSEVAETVKEEMNETVEPPLQ